MTKSDNLRKAKENKNDEFYTRLEDIEAEISQHPDYVRQFQGKTVLCNCDDPEWSNFFVFFKLHFKQLGLKKLICTHYEPSGKPSYALTWEGEMLNDDMLNLITIPLKGNGSFQTDECIELLKQADIVVTNPPFSKFREYIQQLLEYNKDFVVIGNPNAIAYKEFFPLLKNNKVSIGYKTPSGGMWFYVTKNREQEIVSGTVKTTWKYIGEVLCVNCPGIWYTTLDLDKAHEPLILTKNYHGNEDKYPTYDNYDAIECSKVKEIPKDYFESWGVSPDAYAKLDPSAWSIVSTDYSNSTVETYWIVPAKGTELRKLMDDEVEGYVETISNAIDESIYRSGNIGVPVTYLANHCAAQMQIVGSDTSLASPITLESGKRGSGRFYVHNEVVYGAGERERERERERETIIQQNRHQATYRSGVMGVPITYLATHCMEQMTIIGSGTGDTAKSIGITKNYRGRTDLSITVNGKKSCPYNRILVRRNIETA